MHSTSNGYSGLQSFSWDSSINNGATTFDNVSNFVFNKDTLQNSVQFNSESLVTDFENSDSGFVNSSINLMRKVIRLLGTTIESSLKELSKGPDDCASGDMCWGTNILMEIIPTTSYGSKSLH